MENNWLVYIVVRWYNHPLVFQPAAERCVMWIIRDSVFLYMGCTCQPEAGVVWQGCGIDSCRLFKLQTLTKLRREQGPRVTPWLGWLWQEMWQTWPDLLSVTDIDLRMRIAMRFEWCLLKSVCTQHQMCLRGLELLFANSFTSIICEAGHSTTKIHAKNSNYENNYNNIQYKQYIHLYVFTNL